MASVPINQNKSNDLDGPAKDLQDLDVIIVGAGFSGIYSLYRARKEGLKAHVFEAASDFGGVWFWNRYPGARVDSEMPFYQLNIPEVYNTWNFSQRFPDHVELRKYMAHLDKTLNLRPDVSFNTKVTGCTWDASSSKWTVQTSTGITARAQYIVLATGLLHKTHLPTWQGMDQYKGIIRHSGEWPEETDVSGKRVAIIGAGATGVQIVQEVGKTASHLAVLIRRPSYCLPMRQRTWTKAEQDQLRGFYPALFAAGRKSNTGFPVSRLNKRVQDVSTEEREGYLNELWEAGAMQFLLRNYNNVSIDPEANTIIYDYWKRQVRKRLTNPKKQAIMAPEKPPYYFSTKRSPLEQDYYDVLNQDNVEIVDIKDHPIESFTKNGLQLGGEPTEREFDYIICATGFDSFTGSLTRMGLTSKDGKDIKEIWQDGVKTYLGMTFNGYPNTFMVFSPQAPTALSNGPSIIECQCDFVFDSIVALRKQGIRAIEPTREAEDEWKHQMNEMVKNTLYPFTDSWWNTSNIPGKKAENQNYILGLKTYEDTWRDRMHGWKGFNVVEARM